VKLIEMTDEEGNQILINPAAVVSVKPFNRDNEKKTGVFVVKLVGGAFERVKAGSLAGLRDVLTS
jgi:hypothetical protein